MIDRQTDRQTLAQTRQRCFLISDLRSAVERTSVRINDKPRWHSVSVHDAIFDLSIDPHVSIVSLDVQDKRSWWLILQHRRILTVALTLRAKTHRTQNDQPVGCALSFFIPADNNSGQLQSPPWTWACCCWCRWFQQWPVQRCWVDTAHRMHYHLWQWCWGRTVDPSASEVDSVAA